MSWDVAHDPTINVVVVTYTGRTTGEDLRAATSAAIALGKETGTSNFLVDATDLEITASIFDIYALPTQQYVEGAKTTSRIAVIRPTAPDAVDAANFYETVCRNRGWFTRLFGERQSAVSWLVSDAMPIIA